MLFETERLFVRPFCPDDAPYMLHHLNEPSYKENIVDRGIHTEEAARQYIIDSPMASYDQHGYGLWWVGDRETGEPVGMAGVLKRDWLDHADLGYALLPEFWGKGLATEVNKAIMIFARERLNLVKLFAIVSPDNVPSIKQLERLGFEDKGIIPYPGTDDKVSLFEVDL